MQPLLQWFLIWVWSNPRCSASQFQGFCGKRFWAIKVKFTTRILFFQLRKVRWMLIWNLWGTVPPTRLRTTALLCQCNSCVSAVAFRSGKQSLKLRHDVYWCIYWDAQCGHGICSRKTGRESYMGCLRDSCFSVWWEANWELPTPLIPHCCDVWCVLGGNLWLPKDANVSDSCTSDRCSFSSSGTTDGNSSVNSLATVTVVCIEKKTFFEKNFYLRIFFTNCWKFNCQIYVW